MKLSVWQKLLILLGLADQDEIEANNGIFRCAECGKIHSIPRELCDVCDNRKAVFGKKEE
jgi:rubrerythrin